MRSIAFSTVDSFTDQPFSGNPAGVVPDAAGLSQADKQLIARELNLSETAFVTRPADPAEPLRFEWFTPAREVRFCGHATLAALHALAERGELQAGRVAIRGLIGDIFGSVESRPDGTRLIGIEVPEFELGVPPVSFAEIAVRLGLPAEQPALPLGFDTKLKYLFVPVDSRAALDAIKYSLSELADFGSERGIDGFCCYSLETPSPDAAVYSRFFMPSFGLYEDPVTGSSQAPLAALLHSAGLADREIVAEQGHAMQRPGRVTVRLPEQPGQRAQIAGQAVTLARGEMRLAD